MSPCRVCRPSRVPVAVASHVARRPRRRAMLYTLPNICTLATKTDVAKTQYTITKIAGHWLWYSSYHGGTIGTGILRKPGTIALQVGDPMWIMLCGWWGYMLFGVLCVIELAVSMPQAEVGMCMREGHLATTLASLPALPAGWVPLRHSALVLILLVNS